MPITIELDRGQGPYKGGDVVAGKVIVINSSEQSRQLSHDLTITFVGKAWTQWKEGKSSKNNLRQYLVSKWEIETYFNQSFLLLQPGSTSATRTIEPGITELPFIFQLPPNLPNTFTSKHGGVTYTAQVLYRRPWKWDKLVQRDINVQGTYNLSFYPVTTQPGFFTLVKKVWCGFGKIKANLLIPKRGFLPGEELQFKLELENDTRLHLKKIRVHLLQITTYFAQTSTRQEMKKCCKLKCPSVPPRQNLDFQGAITVPVTLPPTNLGSCRIVQPRYCLLLKIKTGIFGKTCFYSVLEGRVPISIGTPEPAANFRPTITICHVRNNSSGNYSSRATLSHFDGIAGTTNHNSEENLNSPLVPVRGGGGGGGHHVPFWNICAYGRDEYDSDPPPSYEDAVALPPIDENSLCVKALPS